MKKYLFSLQFLFDLMICSRSNQHKLVKDFVLTSPAPVYFASTLSRHFRAESSRDKEYSKDHISAAQECEVMAKDFITVVCAEDSETVLNSKDYKDVAFLDYLLDCEQKGCVSHPFVQQYVTDIW